MLGMQTCLRVQEAAWEKPPVEAKDDQTTGMLRLRGGGCRKKQHAHAQRRASNAMASTSVDTVQPPSASLFQPGDAVEVFCTYSPLQTGLLTIYAVVRSTFPVLRQGDVRLSCSSRVRSRRTEIAQMLCR
jgi:protein involved in polysaccharide export with SLBB domain